jgi:hypothetical protein
VDKKAADRTWAACRHSLPVAVVRSHNKTLAPTATSRAIAARSVSDIAGAGAIVVVAIGPIGRNLPVTIRRARHHFPTMAVTSRGSPTDRNLSVVYSA